MASRGCSEVPGVARHLAISRKSIRWQLVSCPPDFAYDDTLYDFISETLGNVIGQVPVYHLECLPDEAAARLSCHTIFGE